MTRILSRARKVARGQGGAATSGVTAMRWLHAFMFAVLLCAAAPAFAVQPDEVLPDPALEGRARALSQELRCMVCQNQSIDDSEAPLARDLRILLRERLRAGDSDRQAIDFLVARYGEFVLLKPVFAWHTVLLWLGPPFALLVGALALFAFGRRRAAPAGAAARLTPAEEARVAELLKSGNR
jgi:cytochrome c-type biogenesis protein CcmH